VKKDKTDRQQGKKTESVPTDNDKQAGSGRRRLLATLGLGGSAAFLPTIWHKPIVQSLVLPAHAQTSPPLVTFGLTDPCQISLSFTCGATGPLNVEIAPTVGGVIVGQGNKSGITMNVSSILTLNGSPFTFPQEISGFTTTDSNGNYLIILDRNGTTGPHVSFDPVNCDGTYPNGVLVTVSSNDPRVPGTAQCSASFNCADLMDACSVGSSTENGSQASNKFYVEMTPVDPTGRKT
jgi:hypothetical protein